MKHGNQKRDEKATVRFNLRLTPTLNEKVESECKRRKVSRNELIRQILEVVL